MRRYFCWIILLMSFLLISVCSCTRQKQIEVLIIGGGASGVAAGIQAARMGSSVIIVEETTWLGGMLTGAGVSAIDGNKKLPAGIWGEFRDSLISHYGSSANLHTGWVSATLFEPSVGNDIFHNITAKENNLTVYKESKLIHVEKIGKEWHAIVRRGGKDDKIVARVLIDATELGDVAKLCGVKYSVGMDDRKVTGEKIAPEKSNHIVQDLTYVAILKDYGRDVSIEKPEGYDPKLFACACINDLCITPKEPDRMWSAQKMINYGKLPNDKYMINWPIEGNDYYLNLIDLTEEERHQELKKAKHFTMCFLYFIQHEIGYKNLGLADDEFPTEDKLPLIPYHRESRRINGVVQFNLNHITDPYTQPEKLYRTTIAVGDYPVDHHHSRYKDYEELPNLYFYPVPSFGLPLGALIPKEVDNLIVAEKSISVTNLVNGTTRLQPVVLQIGQAAGTLAALAIQKDRQIKEISVRDVQKDILANGGYLLPYLDVAKTDPMFKVYQRIGATGILKGVGKNVDWSNETWLRVEDPLLITELDGLKDIYPTCTLPQIDNPLTYADVLLMIENIAQSEKINLRQNIESIIKEKKIDKKATIKRGQFAELVDVLLDPFNDKDVNHKGEFK